MTILLTIVHVLVCVFLVIVVLLQSGKAADLAGAFGGMGSQTAFGPRGAATVLSKATTIAAALFMMTSLTLAIFATRNAGAGTSVLERQKTAPVTQKGAAPAQTAPAPGAQPLAPGQAQQPGAGQPMVEYVDEKGNVVRRDPLDLNKLPKVDPKNPQLPVTPAPAQAPAKKK
jgi:preprotein translocase subunit SecG